MKTMRVVVHYPETSDGWKELGIRRADSIGRFITDTILKLECPDFRKAELLESVREKI